MRDGVAAGLEQVTRSRGDRGCINLACIDLGRSEVLSSLRYYLQAQSQGHHAIDRLEERGVERGSARRSSLKEREGHRQSDEHWNCFKGNVGETSERRGGAHDYGLFRAHR